MAFLFRKKICFPHLQSFRTLHRSRSITTQATFYYLEDREEYKFVKPYHINLPERAFPEGLQSNEVSIPYHGIPVTGMRSTIDKLNLDEHGFRVVIEDEGNPSSLINAIRYEDYSDEKILRSKMRPAVENFLKTTIPGAEDAIVFSHQVRRRSRHFPALPRGTDAAVPQPVQGVHVDMTPDSARSETYDSLRSRGYTDITNRRWAIMSIWRPLFGPMQDWPLALLDYTSIDLTRDLVASDNVYMHKVRETYNVLWNKKHRWYYLEDHQAHEVLLFKTFDTYAEKGHARVCPHAAFRNATTPPDARPRESFECLSVVLWPEGSAYHRQMQEPLPSESPSEMHAARLAEMGGGIE